MEELPALELYIENVEVYNKLKVGDIIKLTISCESSTGRKEKAYIIKEKHSNNQILVKPDMRN